MNKTKGWNEFFNKKENNLIKESIDKIEIQDMRVESSEYGYYYLILKTSVGELSTELKSDNFEED